MKNVKTKISDIVEIKIKPNLTQLFNIVGDEIYNKVNNKTLINNLSFLTKSRIYYDIKKNKL